MGCSVIIRGSTAEVVLRPSAIIAVLSDIHFPHEDPDAMRLARTIIQEAKPDVVVINGDAVDFFGISRYPVSPLRRAHFAEEVAYARDALAKLKQSFAPDAHWVYLEGNHELRMKMFLWRRAPELAGLIGVEDQLHLPQLGMTFLHEPEEPARRFEFSAPQVKISRLFVSHGDQIRLGPATINVARSMFLRLLRPMLIGHWHRKDVYLQTDYVGETSGCWVQGCLAKPRPHWDTGRIWGQGMSIIFASQEHFEVDVIDFVGQPKRKVLMALWRGNRYEVPTGRKSW